MTLPLSICPLQNVLPPMTSEPSSFQAYDNESDDYLINIIQAPATFPDNNENASLANSNSSHLAYLPAQLWDYNNNGSFLTALRHSGSDSGSDCQSTRSCPSSPSLSPLLPAFDGPELGSSVERLSLDTENHGTSPIPPPLTPNFQWVIPLSSDSLLSAPSPSRSEGSESSGYFPPSPASGYPSSPQFSPSPSPQSQSPGNVPHYPPLPHSPQTPSFSVSASVHPPLLYPPQPSSFNANSSTYSTSSYSAHFPQSPSFNRNASYHALDPLNTSGSHHNQSLCVPTSGHYTSLPGTPLLGSPHSPLSSSSEDILPFTPFKRLPHDRSQYEQFQSCKQEPPVVNLTSTSSEIVSEIFECMDGVSSSKDADEIKRKVMSTLGLFGEDQAAKRLFGKPAKNSVSTPAGRQASQKRRIHPAKWKCLICGDSFTRNAGLKNHLKSHVGVTDYECQHCHSVFNTSLSRHEERCNLNPAKVKAQKKNTAQKTTTDHSEMLEDSTLYAIPLY